MHGARLPSSPTRVVALAALAAAGCALGCAGSRAAGQAGRGERHAIPLSDGGTLSVEVPRGWAVKVGELAPGAPSSVRLDAPGGVLFLAPLHDPEAADGQARLDTARLFTELARRGALASATQAELPIRPLRGPDGAELGYFFAATDRDYVPPGPGQERWRNLVRGAISVGRLVLSFTWLDDVAGAGREQALAVVRGVRHEGAPQLAGVGDAGGEGAGSFELTPDPEAATVPLAVDGGGFTVLVDLPGFRMYAPRAAPDGEGTLVLGQEPRSGIVASITLRPAGGAADARACRDARLARLRTGAAAPAEVLTEDDGRSARLSYVLAELKGQPVRQEHAHTFLRRGDACVDVHASKAAPAPGDLARLRAILGTVRFAETL